MPRYPIPRRGCHGSCRSLLATARTLLEPYDGVSHLRDGPLSDTAAIRICEEYSLSVTAVPRTPAVMPLSVLGVRVLSRAENLSLTDGLDPGPDSEQSITLLERFPASVFRRLIISSLCRSTIRTRKKSRHVEAHPPDRPLRLAARCRPGHRLPLADRYPQRSGALTRSPYSKLAFRDMCQVARQHLDHDDPSDSLRFRELFGPRSRIACCSATANPSR